MGAKRHKEFCINRNFYHPNILEYKYYMQRYNKTAKEHEVHLISELFEGVSLPKFISHLDQGALKDLDLLKYIGGQIVSALDYLH